MPKAYLVELEARIAACEATALADCARFRARFEADERERWLRFNSEVGPMRQEREAIIKRLAEAEALKAPPPFVILPTSSA